MKKEAPKKYIKTNGIMKLNPEYKLWKETQKGFGNATAEPVTSVLHSDQALPIVTGMEDFEKMQDSLGDVPMAESTNATIEMYQEVDMANETGLEPDEIIDQLGDLFNKYEIPIGLTNKLMSLTEYHSLEFIIDDSGSMTLKTDSIDPKTKRNYTRWAEAHMRLKEMIDILAYVPFQQIGIEFLNRKDRISLTRQDRTPEAFLKDAYAQIDDKFRRGPSGTTPAYEKLNESFLRGQKLSIARYFFGDGVPNGGVQAIDAITKMVMTRLQPEQNPLTFISCTNEDAAVEWMKDVEEIAPYCSESDDFMDEAREVAKDQGVALPFSKGFHLICQLVAAMNPEDLDAMDESIPFTKFSLDNLLGIVHNEESYRHYFDCFVKAQMERTIGIDEKTGGPNRMDEIRKNTKWDYHAFSTVQGMKNKIPQVNDVKKQLVQAAGY